MVDLGKGLTMPKILRIETGMAAKAAIAAIVRRTAALAESTFRNNRKFRNLSAPSLRIVRKQISQKTQLSQQVTLKFVRLADCDHDDLLHPALVCGPVEQRLANLVLSRREVANES